MDTILTTEQIWSPQDSISATHPNALLEIAAQDIEPAGFETVTPKDIVPRRIASGGPDPPQWSMIITWRGKNFRVPALFTFSSMVKEKGGRPMR